MTLFRFPLVLLALVVAATAAAPTLIQPPSTPGLTVVEIPWTAVPTSTDVGSASTIWLDHISFSVAGTARTITAVDGQASPITWLTAIPLAANQVTVVAFPAGGMRLQGGFSLSASGAGVVYQFRGRIQR
jgi:hypothetical protein